MKVKTKLNSEQEKEMINKQEGYNMGISILKIWMVMSIVVCHFLNTEGASKLSHLFTIYGGTGVSVFVFLSFSLSEVVYIRNRKRIGRKIRRLLLPQCFFAVLYFITYTLIILPTEDVLQGSVGIRSLFWQMLLGAALNPPMWYIADLLILTIFFYWIFSFFRNEKGIIIAILIVVVAILMEYSGFNYELWQGLPNDSKWTVGRFFELIPTAVVGIFFSYYKIMDQLSDHRPVAVVICSVVLILIYKADINNNWKGFYYQGLYQVVTAVCLSGLFWNLPFEKLPERVKTFINRWSCYNMGIIALHYLVKAFYNTFINEVRRLSLSECLFIYAAALAITILGAHIPIKYVREAFT